MKQVEKSLAGIGISAKESSIFIALLELQRANISALGRKTGIPRTTLYSALEKFLIKGIAQKVRVGNHTEWGAVPPEELYRVAKNNLQDLKESLPELEKLYGFVSDEVKPAEILIYKSKEGLRKAYQNILNLRRFDRVYTIEGNKSVNAKLKNLDSFVIDWQEAFKKRGIILEGIIGEKSLELIKQAPKKVLQSHIDRKVITTILPSEIMDFDADIIMFKNTAVITVTERNLSFIIHNREIADTLKHLFLALQGIGRRVDMNAYLKNLNSKQ